MKQISFESRIQVCDTGNGQQASKRQKQRGTCGKLPLFPPLPQVHAAGEHCTGSQSASNPGGPDFRRHTFLCPEFTGRLGNTSLPGVRWLLTSPPESEHVNQEREVRGTGGHTEGFYFRHQPSQPVAYLAACIPGCLLRMPQQTP